MLNGSISKETPGRPEMAADPCQQRRWRHHQAAVPGRPGRSTQGHELCGGFFPHHHHHSVALPLQLRPIMNDGDDSEDSSASESPH